MISDREIWACANAMIEYHGEDAWWAAARRADALLAKGEIDGHRTFMRILQRIKQLEQLTPSTSVH